jgi:hypothetical protein
MNYKKPDLIINIIFIIGMLLLYNFELLKGISFFFLLVLHLCWDSRTYELQEEIKKLKKSKGVRR